MPSAMRGWVRALLVEVARGGLPPETPEILRAASAVWARVEAQVRPDRAAAMVEVAKTFFGESPRAAEAMLREAHDVDVQRRLEELLLWRLEPAWLERYARVDGLEPQGEPSTFVTLAAPHPWLVVTVLGHALPGLGGVVDATPGGRRDRGLAARFDRANAALPAERLTWEAANAVRGRRNLLWAASLGPGGGSRAAGAGSLRVGGLPIREVQGPLRPVTVTRERDKRWRVVVGPSGDFADAESAFHQAVARTPAQFLPWLSAR